MKAKAFAAVAAAFAIVALLLPAAAAMGAQPPPRHHDHPSMLERLAFWGSNGFGIEVALENRQRLTINASASRGPGLLMTNYTLKAPQATGSDDIHASLGKLGRIDVRFVPESVKEEKPTVHVCHGQKTTVEQGRFVGLIEFLGERGYTRARVDHAFGGVGVEPPPSCRNQVGHEPHTPNRVEMLMRIARESVAEAKSKVHLAKLKATMEHSRIAFQADRVSFPPVKGPGGNLLNFIAAATRDRGRIKESSVAFDLLVSGPYFKVPDITHPTSEAVVEPPAPFLGGATFRRESANKVSWDGDLRVNLPGFGVVPLAGPSAHASICADSGCRSKN